MDKKDSQTCSSKIQIAEWLFSNGICRPEALPGEPEWYSNEPHFFDDNDRYSQGVDFYSKRFEHCHHDEEHAQMKIMDATPNNLLHADRVHEFYSRVRPNLMSKLKLIVVLREPIEREMSWFNHEKKIVETEGENTPEWVLTDVTFSNGTIKSFDQYAVEFESKGTSMIGYVDHLRKWLLFFDREQLLVLGYDELKMNPDRAQWRVRTFLGEALPGGLTSENSKSSSSKVKTVPKSARQKLEPLFEQKNRELYDFLDSVPGRPLMEQHPFPQFDSKEGLKLPNVLLIGAQKAGTTSVSWCTLSKHFCSLVKLTMAVISFCLP